jgi:transcriptional regulator with XRE-family HTH domain
MNMPFSQQLTELRQAASLTNRQLASKAAVPSSFIAGLQSGRRRVGEFQATKIGKALGLNGEQLDAFILEAVNTSTEKILQAAVNYPAGLLNWLPLELNRQGVTPEQILFCQPVMNAGASQLQLRLINGQRIATNLFLN